VEEEKKKRGMLQNVIQSLRLGQLLWNKQQKINMRFGTWNIRTLFWLRSLKIVERELENLS
jgi:hypothetical protein